MFSTTVAMVDSLTGTPELMVVANTVEEASITVPVAKAVLASAEMVTGADVDDDGSTVFPTHAATFSR